MSTKGKNSSCVCCGVSFDPTICSQCQVAGCACKKKNEKCRLSELAKGVQQLSEFQVRQELIKLRKEYAELLTEAQRLVRVNHDYETNWPKGLPRLDAAGVDPAALRGKVSMLEAAR